MSKLKTAIIVWKMEQEKKGAMVKASRDQGKTLIQWLGEITAKALKEAKGERKP
jgi:hypothetical protein